LQPLLNFQEYQDRLAWVTILREPLARYISHYQHYVEKMGETKDFKAWMEQPRFWNRQVRKLTGGDDVEAAKKKLATQFCCVGLTEQFNASLLLMRERLGLKDFDVWYVQHVNPSKGEVRRRIMANWEEYRDMITEANQLDSELYQFVLEELWPKQVAEYGEERLKQDLEKEFQVKGFKLRHCYRYWENVVFRRLFHGPYLWFYRRCAS